MIDDPKLYELAKRLTLEAGFDYTDPRTGITTKAQKKHEVVITPETADDLKRLGFKSGLKVAAIGPADHDRAIVVCAFWDGVSRLSLKDNITGDCFYRCGHKIQFRPHSASITMKICPFCAVDRLETEVQ